MRHLLDGTQISCGLVALNAPYLATIAVNAHPTTRILLLPFSNAQALQLPSQLLLRFFRAPRGLRRDNLSTGPKKTEPKPVGVCGFLKGISKVFKICILGSSRYAVDSAFSKSCLETDLLRPKFHQLPGLLALQQKGRSVPQVLGRVRQPCANMSNLDEKITRFFEIPFTAEDLLEDLQVAFIFLFFRCS